MLANDHDLYSVGLPVAFGKTSVAKPKTQAKKKQKGKKQKSSTPAPAKRYESSLENWAEEFQVCKVLREFGKKFTVLDSEEDRMAVADDKPLDYGEAFDEESVEKVVEEAAALENESVAAFESVAQESAVVEEAQTAQSPQDDTSAPATPAHLHKYYQQRYDYFHLFDEGIQIDEEGWYSVTPEAIAQHSATELLAILQAGNDEADPESFTVLDAFCGVGGNSIQFARYFGHVIAVDLDPGRLQMARNNAEVYGVSERISFINGDSFDVMRMLKESGRKIDAVFMSPPWGGPSYVNQPVYDPDADIFSGRGLELFKLARQLTPYCISFLPRQTNIYRIAEMISNDGIGASEESDSFVVEQHWLRNRLKAISIYFYPH